MPSAPPPPRRFKRLRAILFVVLGVVALLGVFVAVAVLKPIHRRAGTTVAEANAPDFTLSDSNGAATSLAALTERGPAVIVFYRGFW